MKLADFDFDTDYATCDGNRVKIAVIDGDTKPRLRSTWREHVITDQNTGAPFTDEANRPKSYVVGLGTVKYLANAPVASNGGNDPWGACKTGSANSATQLVFVDGRWVTYKLGAKGSGLVVDVYDVDHNGDVAVTKSNPTGLLGQMNYRVRDIPGTWLEYMSLHAADLKIRSIRAAVEREMRELQSEMASKMPSGATVSVRPTYNDQQRDKIVLSVALTGADALRYLKGKRVRGLAAAEVVEDSLLVSVTNA